MASVLEDEGLAKRLKELLGTLLDELLDEGLAQGASGGFTARARPAPVPDASSRASTRKLSLGLPTGDMEGIGAPGLR
jgi:hypothetical protein